MTYDGYKFHPFVSISFLAYALSYNKIIDYCYSNKSKVTKTVICPWSWWPVSTPLKLCSLQNRMTGSDPWLVLTRKRFFSVVWGTAGWHGPKQHQGSSEWFSSAYRELNTRVRECSLALFNVLYRHSHKFYVKATLMWLLGKQKETFDLRKHFLCYSVSESVDLLSSCEKSVFG